MTTEELLGFEAHLPRLEARRLRRELQLRPELKLSTETLFDLVLAETGSRDLAEREARDYMASQLRSGQTPQ